MASAPTLGLPQFKGRPGWEFTDISGLDLAAYEPVSSTDDAAAPVTEPLFEVPESDATLPEGVIVTTIGEAADEHGGLLRRHLGSLIGPGGDMLVALNDAGFRAGCGEGF